MPAMTRTISSALTAALLVGLAATTTAPAAHATTGDPVVATPAITVRPLPSTNVLDVSKTGRYIVVTNASGRMELRDTVRERVVKKFPSSAIHAEMSVDTGGTYPSGRRASISDDGRYVTYGVRPRNAKESDGFRYEVRVYDRKTGKTRSATTTKTGRELRPAWTPTCGGECSDPGSVSFLPQFAGGQISGNGKYIVFCANYARADRIDLYVKDWKTKKLSRFDGACEYRRGDDEGLVYFQAPAVSENGNLITLPGRSAAIDLPEGESGFQLTPAKVLLNRRQLMAIGGMSPTMTHDGQIVSTIGPFEGILNEDIADQDGRLLGPPVYWWTRSTGIRGVAETPGIQLSQRNASRHGRYVLTGPGVLDRATNTIHDVDAALIALGNPEIAQPDATQGILTGDGKSIFIQSASGGWSMVRWM